MHLGHRVQDNNLSPPEERFMRSDLIFRTKVRVSNRYQLARLVSRATRALHRPGMRIEDTMNDVLERLSRADPIAAPWSESEQSDVSLHRGRSHPSRSLKAGFEFGRKVEDQPVEVPRCAKRTPSGSFDFRSLQWNVHSGPMNSMTSEQRVE
jgi:hypothetical protein